MTQAAPKPDSAYAPGHVKLSPNWPDDATLVMRTTFSDTDGTGVMSWQTLHPQNGSLPRMHFQVADWPDAPPSMQMFVVVENDDQGVIEGSTEPNAINA